MPLQYCSIQIHPEKKKRDQENKRQLIEFNALSDYQTVIIIIRQC